MPTTTAQLMRRVRRYLSIWAVNVGLDNRVGLTDINKEAEDFYCGLLNAVLNVKLRNLNLEKMDFPAIDLADDQKRLCVQVTSTAGREKIDHTLDRFFHYGLEMKYDRLIVAIIGDKSKKKYRMETLIKGTFAFDPEGDVWDTTRLIQQIGALDMDRLRQVDRYLEEQLGPLTEQPDPLNLPLRTAMAEGSFMGRAAELAEIGKRFETERIVVLSGLGGMGKTELAVRYGRAYAGSGAGRAYLAGFRGDFYRTVVESISLGVEGLAERKLDEPDKYRETMKVLNRCGREDLLIIDNADTEEGSFEALRRELSALPMRVLITTRCDPVGAIDVGALHREELHRIFRLYNGSISEADMDTLIHAVDGHTLTVDLMARLLRRGRRAATADKLLTALNKRDLNSPSFMQIATNYPGGLSQARINEHLRTVFRVAELSPDEKKLLRCATLLPAGGMSDELFMHPFGDEMQDVLDDLIQKGWLLWENDLLKIHPVICIVCREELEPTEESCGGFVKGVWGWYDEKKYDKDKFRQLAELLANAAETLGDTDGGYIGQAGRLWLILGELTQAMKCNRRAVELRETSQPDSNDLAAAYQNLGYTYGSLGDYKKELDYQLKALTIRERILPPEHPDLARSYNNVGLMYSALGDHEQALEFKLKALTIREKVLPPEHLDLAQSYNNVGATYSTLCDFSKTFLYLQKALSIFEKVLPSEHPDLAQSYNNLGGIYGALGDHEQALEYELKALAIREKALPPEHPSLANSYNNVGGTYGKLGDYARALEYQQKALAIREKILPSEHPNLALSYNNVSYTYGALGDHEKELEYDLKTLTIWEKVLPPDHPNITLLYNNVGVTYGELGDHIKALEYGLKALEIREKSLPLGHPDLEASYSNVIASLHDLGDHKKALEYALKHLAIWEKALPPEHPNLAAFYGNVGNIYGTIGEYEKALEYQRKALSILEKLLPPEHPDLVQLCNNVAWTCYKMGEYDAALRYMHRAVDIAERSLPEGHANRKFCQDSLKWMEREERRRRGEE